jgi:acetyl esterase/lipase
MDRVGYSRKHFSRCRRGASLKAAALLLLWSGLLISVASAQEREQPGPVPQPTKGVLVYKDLSYVLNGHVLQKLDLYVPQSSEAPLPLIVWIHGGGWRGGSKDYCPPLLWSRKGYAVASVNYRLSQVAKFPAQIEDCKAAVRWLRDHAKKYRIDPDHMAVWGGSAGGHLASLVGTAGDVAAWEEGHQASSSQVEAVIDWYGRADLTPVSKDSAYADSPSAFLLGGSGSGVAELAREASPILHVSQDDPPFLIMHGEMDKVVPVQQSRAFAEALRKAGVKVNLVVLKRAGHGGSDFLRPEEVSVIDAFLNQYLHLHRGTKSGQNN